MKVYLYMAPSVSNELGFTLRAYHDNELPIDSTGPLVDLGVAEVADPDSTTMQLLVQQTISHVADERDRMEATYTDRIRAKEQELHRLRTLLATYHAQGKIE